MTWIDDNKRPLMAVGAILGVAWFGGRYFDKNQSFNAESYSADANECAGCSKIMKGNELSGLPLRRLGMSAKLREDDAYYCSGCWDSFRQADPNWDAESFNAESFEIDYFDLKAKLNRRIIDERFDIAGEEGRFYLTEHDDSEIDDAYFLILLDKTSLENAEEKEVEIKNAVNNVLVFYGFSDYSFEALDEGFNGTDVIISKGQRQYAETFDAERIQYNYVVHREPKGSSKGGWFKSKKAETFDAELEDEPRAIILYDIVWKTNKDLPEKVYISAFDEETLEGHRDEDIQDYLYERFNDYAHSYKMQHEGGNYTPDVFTDMKRFPEEYGAETFEYTEEWYNSALPRIVKRVKEELVNDERMKLDDPKMYALFEDEMFDGEPTSLDSYVYSALELEYPTLTEKQKIEISEDADMLSDVWFGIDMTDEEFRDWLNEEYDDEGNLISRAETFEAKGYNGISASKIKVLEKYIENGGQALDYHELPYHTQRQLEMGRVHELLYQDVNRWLQDNAHNPHHAMPSWLSAETFEAKGDCAECYGTGGLYDSHMGINDECHSCGGTGFDY